MSRLSVDYFFLEACKLYGYGLPHLYENDFVLFKEALSFLIKVRENYVNYHPLQVKKESAAPKNENVENDANKENNKITAGRIYLHTCSLTF